MSFGDKVIDLFMPTKKENSQGTGEPTGSKTKPAGEDFIRVLAIADYPKRVYGNWLRFTSGRRGCSR